MTVAFNPHAPYSMAEEALVSGTGTRATREHVIADLYNSLVPRSPAVIANGTASVVSGGTEYITTTLINVVSESFGDVMQFGINLSRPDTSVFEDEHCALWSDPALLSKTERYAALLSEFRTISAAFEVRRGEQAQERFMFDRVMPFIERYGAPALEMLDGFITTASLADGARYYYAYLLGHMRDNGTAAVRVRYLSKYVESHIGSLREGAEEAFGHLSAA